MRQLLWKYLIGPIVADAQGVQTAVWNGTTAATGYNPVNTAVYIALASITIYIIYRFLNKKDVEITPKTAIYSTPFILLGGTLRFLDDAQLLPFPYSTFLVTPVIYFLIAAIFVPAIYKLTDQQLSKLGLLLLLPALAYSFTGFQSINAIYALAVLATSTISTGIYYLLLKDKYIDAPLVLLAFTQLFEGSASMLSYFYSYRPKQLLAQKFNSVLGFPGVFVMKILVLAFAISIITDIEDGRLKTLVLVTLYAVGLGTGFRVFLRTIAGV